MIKNEAECTMKNLKICPVCQNELEKSSVFFMESNRLCHHCQSKVYPKRWIRMVSVLISLMGLLILFEFVGTLSGVFIIFVGNAMIFLLSKIYGYDFETLDDEEYIKEKAKFNELDSQGYDKNRQLIKFGSMVFLIIFFFFFLPSLLYRMNIIEFNQMFIIEGLIHPFAWFLAVMLILYMFKDKWFYRIFLNKLKFIPLMISMILAAHILSLMLNFFVFDAFEIYFDLYFTKLLQTIVIGLIIQFIIIKKTNLR